MNKFEQRRKNSLERARKMIEENDGILINEELRNDKKVHLQKVWQVGGSGPEGTNYRVHYSC